MQSYGGGDCCLTGNPRPRLILMLIFSESVEPQWIHGQWESNAPLERTATDKRAVGVDLDWG